MRFDREIGTPQKNRDGVVRNANVNNMKQANNTFGGLVVWILYSISLMVSLFLSLYTVYFASVRDFSCSILKNFFYTFYSMCAVV